MLCQRGSLIQGICDNVLFLIAGYDSEQLNKTVLPLILAHTPAGASSKQLTHYSQLMKMGKFHLIGNDDMRKNHFLMKI
ncbi:lipase member K-like, partial [Diaphorina citri]|uniref:Lipase member K-like n=1 Tax=Diaphorina citri TaxID=121845 RepID=A0A1S3DUL8_DIACI